MNLLDRDSPVPMRLREIAILRVSANLGCEYEWGVHVAAFAEHVGLEPAQVEATWLSDHRASCWAEDEALLIEVIDQLCATGRVTATTRAALQATWTVEQQLEILALCGNYHTIAFVANVAELEPEPFGARAPDVPVP